MLHADLLTSPYADRIAQYLKTTDYLVIFMLDAQLCLVDYNPAFSRMIQHKGPLTGKCILDLLSFESRDNHPFRDQPESKVHRLIFITSDHSSFSLDCTIYREPPSWLVLGGHLMLTRDKTLDCMTQMSNELINLTRELHMKNKALVEAQTQVKVLGGLIPICSYCKKIRDDNGYWTQLEKFITENSEALFSHSICPKCLKIHHAEYLEDNEK